jgi:branched-chain amino acid aminotransferase/4-amino-4-deoxychorismate lyase
LKIKKINQENPENHFNLVIKMIACINGVFEDLENYAYSVCNRAFEYGDGVFETIIARNNTIYFWQDHFQRLLGGMKALYFDISPSFTADYLQNIIFEIAQKNNFSNYFRIKINVWRETGGLYTPQNNHYNWLVRVFPATEKHNIIKEKAVFFEDVRLVASNISPYKTLNALPYVLAGIYKQQQQADEVILLSHDDCIAETSASNIFWIKNNVIYYPSLACGGKKGILQTQIIRRAKELKIETQEGKFLKNDLLEAEVVFTSNVAGIESIQEIENTRYQTEHPYITEFRELIKF